MHNHVYCNIQRYGCCGFPPALNFQDHIYNIASKVQIDPENFNILDDIIFETLCHENALDCEM